jgi:hypothetical protein
MNFSKSAVNDVKAKIGTIRTRHSSDLTKIKSSEKNGTRSNDVHVSQIILVQTSRYFFARYTYIKEGFNKYAGKFKSKNILLF